MARRYEMSWEGDPRFRWVKMWKGVRYRVTCADLKAKVWTKDGSAALANAWWARKRAELDGPSPAARILESVERMPLERLREMMERGEAAKRLLAELPFVAPDLTPEEIAPVVGRPPDAAAGRDMDQLADVVGKAVGPQQLMPAGPGRTYAALTRRFLRLSEGKRPQTWRELHEAVNFLAGAPGLGPDVDVGTIDAERVEAVYVWLRDSGLAPVTKKKRWRIFKTLVRYFWEAGSLDLPRNLDSRALRFRVAPHAVKVWPLPDVRGFLAATRPRYRLWALLGLNCGMTNVDIGALRKDQVDLTRGRLVRKRVKTADHADVPTVDYALWPETADLLRDHWSGHAELVFVTERGTPLVDHRRQGDRVYQKDAAGASWRFAAPAGGPPPIPLKAFRSISATLLESHAAYGRYKAHFLGHSPKSVADKHYAAPSAALFDEALAWLRSQLFPA